MKAKVLALLLSLSPFIQAQIAQEVLVSSRATHSVKVWNQNGDFLQDLVSSGSGGLQLTEDILFHPDGSLLVSGFGNQAIKRYHAISGEYLGDFSSGYTLSQPSKMSLGPDSLIYITQWSGSQKVVRFALDGTFVDEFTQTAVNKGLGHFWEDSTFYIAAFADGMNGFIEHFDKQGNSLGAYLGSAKMDGPTSIWKDDSSNLYITDWTKGQVLKFDSAKNFFGAFINANLQQPEGFARLENGNWLIGDWGLDKVQMFDSTGNFISEIAGANGLRDPNAVRVRPSLGLQLNPKEKASFKAYQQGSELIIEASQCFDYELLNALGQFMKQGNSKEGLSLEGLRSGVYFIKPLAPSASYVIEPIHLQAPR